jgi:parallel beta-helix repeat protein
MTRRAWEASARWAALGVLLGGLGAAVGPAEAVTLIQSCPYTIMQPGVYVLARDLTCPGSAVAIRITADNVVLNLNGRTLTGDDSGYGVLAEGTDANPTLEGLRVENGAVRGFRFDGVSIEDAPGARVAGVTATDNRFKGILVRHSPGARVEGNTAGDNGGTGLQLDPCDSCRVLGNRATGNADVGIVLLDGTGTRLESNTATGNGDDGIRLQTDADGNLVRGNTLTDNGGNGLELDSGATDNLLEGNRATGNGTGTGSEGDFDLADENLDDDPPACVNTWRGNTFVTDNEGDGPGAGCIQ